MELPPALLWGVPGLAAGFVLAPLLPRGLKRLRLARTNFQGNSIHTGGGLLFLPAGLAWLLISPGQQAAGLALALLGFGVLGFIDDRWGSKEIRGVRGHLGALLRGRVTTGALKAAGGVAVGLAAAGILRPGAALALSGLLIALSANFFNLLDLRPLRVLKVFWLLALPLTFYAAELAVVLGLSLPYAAWEARRRVMLGDTGANALGGLTGACLALVLPLWAQAVGVLLLLLLHAWCERHSLSVWIDRHRLPCAIDRWGTGYHGPECRNRKDTGPPSGEAKRESHCRAEEPEP
jgi:UDP-GlcNAc:undecaprenyl-phosphate/decaprenyl-phosphate GlcNAc-1-phosphate transferase